MERLPAGDANQHHRDTGGNAETHGRPGHSQVYAPSEYPESVASGSDSVEGNIREGRSGTGQVYTSSLYAESVASRSEREGSPLEGLYQGEDASEVRTGSAAIYAPSNYAQSVASISISERGQTSLGADRIRIEDTTDVRTGSATIYAPSNYAESVASSSKQGETPLGADGIQNNSSDVRTGSATIYAPSNYAESVASSSKQGETPLGADGIQNNSSDVRTGSAVIYTPSNYAESVASSSKQRETPQGADGIQNNSSDVRTGSATIYAPSKYAESVASSSKQRESHVNRGDQSENTNAGSGQGAIQVPSQYAESVTSGPPGTVSRIAEPWENLAEGGLQWPRSGAGEVYSPNDGDSMTSRTAPARGDIGENSGLDKQRRTREKCRAEMPTSELQPESLTSMQIAEDEVTWQPSQQEGIFKYELVNTIPTEAKAINIRFDKLYTLSATVLLTEYNPGSPHSPVRDIQFKLREPKNFSNIRFTFQLWLKTTVVVADGRLFLLDHNGREIWSDQTDLHVYDISADFYIEGRVHVLTSTGIRIHHLAEDRLEFINTVVPLPGLADSGKTYMFGDSLYISRETAGLVVKMDTNACQITDVFRDLMRPITAMTIGWIENSPEQPIVALGDKRNVHIYSKDAFDLLFTVPVGSNIIDIELISCKLFVLTDNGIKIYKLSKR